MNVEKKTLFQTSLGHSKLKGLKKINLNSIQITLNSIYAYLSKHNFHVHLNLKGLNKYKKLVLKNLKQYNIHFLSINDKTLIVHNGCKKKATRKL